MKLFAIACQARALELDDAESERRTALLSSLAALGVARPDRFIAMLSPVVRRSASPGTPPSPT